MSKNVSVDLVYEGLFLELQNAVKTNIDLMNTILDSLSHFKNSTDNIQAELNKKYKSLPKENIKSKASKSIFKRKKDDSKQQVPEQRLKEIMDAMFLSIIDPDNVSFFVKKMDDIFLSKFTDIRNQYVRGNQRMTSNYEKSMEELKKKQLAYENAKEQYDIAFNKALEAYNIFKADRTPELKEQFNQVKIVFLECQKALENSLDTLNRGRLTFNEDYNITLAIWEEAEVARQNTVNTLLKDFSTVIQTLAAVNKTCAMQMKQIEKIYDFDADHPQYNNPVFNKDPKDFTFVEFSTPELPIDITEFIPTAEYFDDELAVYEDVLTSEYDGDVKIPAGTIVTVYSVSNGTADICVTSTGESAVIPTNFLAGKVMNQRRLMKCIKETKCNGYKLKEGAIVVASNAEPGFALCTTSTNIKIKVPVNNLAPAFD
ncbi:hypothetical protein TVAG_121990 [Trichomonas vaginalis G3]|uniref:SH3 domain containing protein n=1 Tax=Trichomonas vaginalis (strain ATCC PRA-98 / G3) TaxID=412133 RepID=A2E9B0_TRIV3|nr:arfaptin homology (AH) domain/bar domain domain-containing protein [Trichomonas vaginalis G3]EAY10795.1 hypothetical protein TVAG_121990 [Trichomonas vaginalis G3]KAI5536065.1 arfaptin homology (AH) domain/bar domain domain-containing protein [Trichomonas vaginalis G3]|eukprot:XP_001323018.1 hypothetical protein [Trichomonas vaginalis G3]